MRSLHCLQLKPGDLSVCRFGQFGDHVYGGASPLGRKRLPNSFGDVVHSTIWNDEERERFFSFWMLHCTGGTLTYARNGRQLRFHLSKTHTDASNFYKLPRTSLDPEVALIVTAAEVSSLEPPPVEPTLRCLSVIEVSRAD